MAFNGLCYIYKVTSEYKYLQERCSTNIHLFKDIKKKMHYSFFIASEYTKPNSLLSNCESVLEGLEYRSHVIALDPSCS